MLRSQWSPTAIVSSERICCPNCGCFAHRRYYASTADRYRQCPGGLVNQVDCPKCDYLLISCAASGRVLEAYSGLASPMPPVG